MTTQTKKVLFNAAIAGITIFTVYRVSKKLETKYTNVSTPDHPAAEDELDEEIDDTVSDVKDKIHDAAVKMVNWIIAHKDGIDAFTSCFSLAASIYTLKGAINKSKTPSSIDKRIIKDNKDGEFVLNTSRQGEVNDEKVPRLDVKPGNLVIGEWAKNNETLHFTVV